MVADWPRETFTLFKSFVQMLRAANQVIEPTTNYQGVSPVLVAESREPCRPELHVSGAREINGKSE